ncbi:VOC family protein [Umezawaea endophytica]|uniref:VOC family protein n=1 Tax=Umezawaea endophytica TaxID=1654476 RepID=A0A9X2VJG1_9PSEU|nr:VOC family protein [Umezawaea endophytica]MCS7477711.1 VOC family protein [Umezawaea endophytica]
MRRIGLATVLVDDVDAAIAFYVDALGFDLAEDVAQPDGGRWVVVRPSDAPGTGLLLARAGADDRGPVGRHVAFFLHTDDFAGDHERMTAAGVRFLEEPRQEPYGTVAVFEDLCGNRFDLIQPAG